MTLGETSVSFLAFITDKKSSCPPSRSHQCEAAVLLLREYFTFSATLSEITPGRLRDFLGKWYVEKACTLGGELESCATDTVPDPLGLIEALAQFFKWSDQQAGTEVTERCSPVLLELTRSLPRAVEITAVLSRWLRERGGAFSFPEFLTSFEEGGHSEYDLDTPGRVGALEGYFRILRVDGSSVEAEELISEERVWPIVFPPDVASLLDDQYIINLELVRGSMGWQIAGCGFAYPPRTDV